MNFFKNFLASLLAVVVGLGVITMIQTMIFVGIIASMGSFGKSQAVIESESVLRLNPGVISDSPASSPFAQFDFATMTPTPHNNLLGTIRTIETAATDDRIKGIYMNLDEYSSMSLPALEEIRAALVRFKESGKFIVAYEEVYGQAGYYFASVADRVYLNPVGMLEWRGLSAQIMFFKGLLDKLGVEPVIFRHGQFKSAVEPYMLDKMSAENRLQYETFTGAMWNYMVDEISASRNIPAADLQKMADELTINLPKDALENKLVDGLLYEDEVMNEIKALIAGEGGTVDTEKDVKIVQFGDYASHAAMTAKNSSKNKIAVVYAEGDIVSGEGEEGSIGSASMVKRLQEVRRDENVKAVVFRINSPGGSALASDVMWHELTLLKEKKPLIVSMGNYAASGGYYIACPADAIFADRTTLTGSIGVFALYPNLEGALKKNLGITVDGVNTNTYSHLGTPFHTPSPAEAAWFQNYIEDTYSTFISHVAEGRNMTTEAVDNIGQGRVWAGANAREIGLVDEFGGIKEAIALAADRGGVADDFRVWEVSPAPTGLAALFAGFSARVKGYIRTAVLRDEMGEAFVQYENLREMLDEKEVQARLPYVIEIK